MRAVYATVERVMRAADVKSTAYAKEEILAALESASDSVDNLVNLGDATRPGFAPWIGSIAFDWPIDNNSDAYRFWLNEFRLHSLSTMESGGESVTSFALPWPASGPPYAGIDIDTAGTRALEIGPAGTGQRSLMIGGTWGTLGTDRSRPSWTIGGAVSASADLITINAPIGIGSLLLAGSERMIVTDRAWADSGQTSSALAANMGDVAVTVADGSAFLAGEEIIVDSERLLIRDIVGDTLIVQRAASGSVLAAHAGGAIVSWSRSCTVERGVLGTVAESHASGATISIYVPPPLIERLTVAYAIDQRASETVGYARSLEHIRDRQGLSAKKVGGDVGATGIPGLEDRVLSAYGRIRTRAI